MNLTIAIVLVSILVVFFLFTLFLRKQIVRGKMSYELATILPFWYRLLSYKVKPMWEKRYNYGQHWRQYLLFLMPENQKITKDHIIIYIHGGGWRMGRPDFFRSNAQWFVQQGYGVILPSYRRVPQANYHDLREDLNGLLHTITHILEEHQLQDKKIILGGVSAGGNLAAHMLYNRKALQQCGWSQKRFSGLFLLASPLDLTKMRSTVVLRFYAGGKEQHHLEKASPISYLEEEESIPVLCVHGTKDGLVAYASAESFAKKLMKINPELMDFRTLENATHLDTSRWAYQEDEVRRIILKWVNEVDGQVALKNVK